MSTEQQLSTLVKERQNEVERLTSDLAGVIRATLDAASQLLATGQSDDDIVQITRIEIADCLAAHLSPLGMPVLPGRTVNVGLAKEAA